ncbi:MAG: cadherin-like beta sandwich domain-containing protein, partial [Gammaproteobacteria bacterium]
MVLGSGLSYSGTSLTLLGLQGGITYQVRILGNEEEEDQGEWSDVSEITVPAAPALMSASRSGNTISLAWAALSGATGYKVRWARTGQDWINSGGAAGEAVTGLSYDIPGLTAGQNYNIQIAAATAAGPGAWTISFDQTGKTPSADATLSSLVFTDKDGADIGGGLSLTLLPDTRMYSLTWSAGGDQKVRLRPTATDDSPSSIAISREFADQARGGVFATGIGDPMVANGALSVLMNISLGLNRYTIAVVAENGVNSETYVVLVEAQNNVAALGELVVADPARDIDNGLGALAPAFVAGDTTRLAYRKEVPAAQASVIVYTEALVSNNAVAPVFYVDGTQQTSPAVGIRDEFAQWRSREIALTAGTPSVVEIATVSEDASAHLTYSLTILRLGSGSGDSSLSALAVAHSGGAATLNKVGGDGSAGFAAAHLAYAATFESSVDSVTITPTAGESNASITIGKRGAAAAAIASDAASTQTLEYGLNTLDLTVSAQNSAQRIYTLALTRTPQSTDATLQSLTLSEGTLEPGFSPGMVEYTASVPTDTGGITLTPTVNNALASVTVAGTKVTSGMASASQTLQHGSNQIVIQVTAEDGSTMDYTVTVTRIPPAASSNADLSALVLVDGVADQTFAVGSLTHTASVANNVASVKIRPTVADTGKATVMVNGDAVDSGEESGLILLEV